MLWSREAKLLGRISESMSQSSCLSIFVEDRNGSALVLRRALPGYLLIFMLFVKLESALDSPPFALLGIPLAVLPDNGPGAVVACSSLSWPKA